MNTYDRNLINKKFIILKRITEKLSYFKLLKIKT